MPVMDMQVLVKDTIEPLKRDIKDLREEVKRENATQDVVIEELKHELAELKVQQAHASAQVPAQAQQI